jgi:4-hydroxy-tetrahydrodipicolinate synthase
MMFTGTYPALVTPLREGKVDLTALRGLIAHVLDGGVDGLLACGTTGEAPTLRIAEWESVVSTCVAESRGKPVIAGTGTNDTLAVIEKTRRAAELGAAAALVVSPYYNKPSPAGLIAHFTRVADEGGLPIILYNVPSRTGSNMSPEVVEFLSNHPQIVGIKDAAGSVDQFGELLRRCGSNFSIFSGDDSLALPLYALGGHGAITTVGNVAPGPMARLYHSFCEGQVEEARKLHFQLVPLFQALFCEVNPCPVKFALHKMGFVRNELRLPLAPITPASEELVLEALVAAKIALES